MPKRRETVYRDFKCPVCGARITMPKRKGRTHAGHIKHIWCYVCKQVQPFEQEGTK